MFHFLTASGRSFLAGVLHLVYPAACWSCGRFLSGASRPFCLSCDDELTGDAAPTCPRCASTVGPYTDLSKGCPECRDAGFAFARAFRLGPYDGRLRELVLRMKNGNGEGLAEQLGALWAEHAGDQLSGVGPEVVVPVPLHWSRWLRRGYNQSEVLARALASRLRLPCRPGLLRRCRATPQQTLQPSPHARRENVRGAFRASATATLQGRTILLVDDVLTTGATASEAARALRHAGAARIVVAVLAHGH